MNELSGIQGLINGGGSSRSRSDDVGQEQFLELLVAQMENQDPLKPVENGEFLTQIAQFSTASGVGELQESFESLASSLQRNQLSTASSMLGRDILYQADSAVLADSGAIDGQLSLPSFSSQTVLRVSDINGSAVTSINLGPQNGGTSNFSWDGNTASGARAPSGAYVLTASAVINGVEQALPVQMYGRVDSVSVDPGDGQVNLQLQDGNRLALNNVYEFK